MRSKTPPMAWGWLAAILFNVLVFDILILRWDDPGGREFVLAGVIGITGAVVILLVAQRLARR